MTERGTRLAPQSVDKISVSGLVDASLRPGGSISLAFSDGIVNVTLDQTGDWTITAGLSVSSDRVVRLTKTFEELGFFHATEQGGMIYHLWTSALSGDHDGRNTAEETLLKVLKCFQDPFVPSYIS